MQADHYAELHSFQRTPRQQLIYALGMLSDVVDGNMTGEDRDIHVNDAKEIILDAWDAAKLADNFGR